MNHDRVKRKKNDKKNEICLILITFITSQKHLKTNKNKMFLLYT